MFRLPDLPYPADALEPTLSRATMETHWGRHHKAYVDKTNELAAAAGLQGRSLEEVVVASAERRAENPKLFNNAGQAWNHGFFWNSMTPPGGAAPSGEFALAVEQAFGDQQALRDRFVEEGVNHFASGWAWIVWREGRLQVTSTHDADTALVHEGTPILVCDLWEHAYYLDYKQDRKSFLERWFDTVANWSFASSQLQAAQAGQQGWRWPE